MIKLGLGLPGVSVADTRRSAEAAADYAFDSFSVYGDQGDLPPYAVLHAAADILRDSDIRHIGPFGVPVGMMHHEVISVHAAALEEQLPGQTAVGLVRGAREFLQAVGERPASLELMEKTVRSVRHNLLERELRVPIYIGGFGPKVLKLAGTLAVQGVKLGGSTNEACGERAKSQIDNPAVEMILGAVSVIDPDRKAARQRARQETAKYLDVVGRLDKTLEGDDLESLQLFLEAFKRQDPTAPSIISDSLLDKFALAGTPDDALDALAKMEGVVDRFEFGTPHGLNDRPAAIKYIGDSILRPLKEQK